MGTGVAPFRGSPCLAVLKQVCESEPEPIRSLNAAIPAWLEGIIRKLHAKDPAQRFASAAEVADLLERCLAHVQQRDRCPLPAEARQLSTPRPAGRRPRVLQWSATLLVLVLVVVVGYARRRGQGAMPVLDIALTPADAGTLTAFDEPLLEESRALRAQVQRLRQSFVSVPSHGSPLDDPFRFVRERITSLHRDLWRHPPPETDPVENQFAAIRAALSRLQQSSDFSPSNSFQRFQEGEYP